MKHFLIDSRQNSKYLNDLIMKVSIYIYGYSFADQKIVISCNVRHFRIKIRQNSESLNLLIMQVSVQLLTIISVNAELLQGLPRPGVGLLQTVLIDSM